MTGPDDPNHDLPEPLPVVLPVWRGKHGFFLNPLSGGSCKGPSVRVVLPHAWGLAIDPEKGAVVRHAVRSDLPSLLPAAVVGAAKLGAYGFRLLDDKEGGM